MANEKVNSESVLVFRTCNWSCRDISKLGQKSRQGNYKRWGVQLFPCNLQLWALWMLWSNSWYLSGISALLHMFHRGGGKWRFCGCHLKPKLDLLYPIQHGTSWVWNVLNVGAIWEGLIDKGKVWKPSTHRSYLTVLFRLYTSQRNINSFTWVCKKSMKCKWKPVNGNEANYYDTQLHPIHLRLAEIGFIYNRCDWF